MEERARPEAIQREPVRRRLFSGILSGGDYSAESRPPEAAMRYSEGVMPILFLKMVWKVLRELNPES